MKRTGFTLIELLVVIGIIGILATIMVSVMSGGNESALALKCMANLKNLASGCQAHGMATRHYPTAGSFEKDVNDGYMESPGWLSWNSNGAYGKTGVSGGHIASAGWYQSAYNQDYFGAEYCYTNGSLWKYVAGNRSVFICPTHAREKRFHDAPPKWSYVMNAYFGWQDSPSQSYPGDFPKVYGTVSHADRRLLFAEMQFIQDDTSAGLGAYMNASESSGTECDCVLQYKAPKGGKHKDEGDEVIGFNHKAGKRDWYAHVVFTDGHTERLHWPREGMKLGDLQELTGLLCEGMDVAYSDGHYKKVEE